MVGRCGRRPARKSRAPRQSANRASRGPRLERSRVPSIPKPADQPADKAGGSRISSRDRAPVEGRAPEADRAATTAPRPAGSSARQLAVKVFDAVLDAMGDSDEYRSLVEILKTLQTLGRNASGFRVLLDPDKAALTCCSGWCPSPLDALEAWATNPPPAAKPATSKGSRRGTGRPGDQDQCGRRRGSACTGPAVPSPAPVPRAARGARAGGRSRTSR